MLFNFLKAMQLESLQESWNGCTPPCFCAHFVFWGVASEKRERNGKNLLTYAKTVNAQIAE